VVIVIVAAEVFVIVVVAGDIVVVIVVAGNLVIIIVIAGDLVIIVVVARQIVVIVVIAEAEHVGEALAHTVELSRGRALGRGLRVRIRLRQHGLGRKGDKRGGR
ncbi:MAG: hypothetical protein AAFW69_09240, partial [Pseudomonadota bacterium]